MKKIEKGYKIFLTLPGISIKHLDKWDVKKLKYADQIPFKEV